MTPRLQIGTADSFDRPDIIFRAADRSEVELSIVMPCLNEAETIGICIVKAQRALQDLGTTGEIIVADNGSTDGSAQIAATLGARVVRVSAKGYGSALMGGIGAARGKYVIIGDADDSYNFGEIGGFLSKLREGNELVMGNRFKGRIDSGAMPLLHRYLGNPFLSGLGRLFFRSKCGDFHCGLRGFRKASIMSLGLQTTGMEFASEMVVKAALRKLRIAEVPASLSRDGRSRSPHLRTWRDGWRHLRFMLLYSPEWLFLVPGFILIVFGVIFGGRLLLGPITIGRVGFDTNTLLVCAMAMLIGFQLIVFATLAKIFAISEGLIPEDPPVAKLLRAFTLESGIMIGLFAMGGGFWLLTSGVLYWGRHAFGPISYSDSLRMVIPGVTAVTLGIEIIFSSFFASALALARK